MKGELAVLGCSALSQAGSGSRYEGPRSEEEEMVCGIWGELLGLERVGVEDNFFELGGHSLLVTQVMSRVGEVMEREVPLRIFFENPTVAGLARELQRYREQGGVVQGRVIRARSREGYRAEVRVAGSGAKK